MGGVLRTRVEVAPAQGAIPGILRFGTREQGLRRGERDTQSWVGGGAWPLGSPSGPNLGLSFPWPCPLPLLDASGRGGGAQSRCPVCRLAGDWSVSHPCLSVSPGPQRWGSLSGWGQGSVFVSLRAPCMSVFLSLPHRRMSSVSLPAPSLALSSCPHLCLSGWGWGSWFIHLRFPGSLSLRLQVPYF